MKLYFSTSKKRLAFDTDTKTYSTDYFYLGGWKSYIKISTMDFCNLKAELIREGYKESNSNF